MKRDVSDEDSTFDAKLERTIELLCDLGITPSQLLAYEQRRSVSSTATGARSTRPLSEGFHNTVFSAEQGLSRNASFQERLEQASVPIPTAPCILDPTPVIGSPVSSSRTQRKDNRTVPNQEFFRVGDRVVITSDTLSLDNTVCLKGKTAVIVGTTRKCASLLVEDGSEPNVIKRRFKSLRHV